MNFGPPCKQFGHHDLCYVIIGNGCHYPPDKFIGISFQSRKSSVISRNPLTDYISVNHRRVLCLTFSPVLLLALVISSLGSKWGDIFFYIRKRKEWKWRAFSVQSVVNLREVNDVIPMGSRQDSWKHLTMPYEVNRCFFFLSLSL